MTKPEKKLQDSVVAYLKGRGIYCLNLFGDGFSGKGKPDVIACVNGLFVAFELKVDLNDMQADQIIHKRRIERSNGLHYAPRSLAEVIDIIEELTR